MEVVFAVESVLREQLAPDESESREPRQRRAASALARHTALRRRSAFSATDLEQGAAPAEIRRARDQHHGAGRRAYGRARLKRFGNGQRLGSRLRVYDAEPIRPKIMATSGKGTPAPTEIKLHQKSQLLEISFADGKSFKLPSEFLRVYSPSAEVRGHGPGQEVLQVGKKNVEIAAIEPVGSYAVQLTLLRRPRYRHLLVGPALRLRRAAGRDVAALSQAPRRSRRQSRKIVGHDQDHRLRFPAGARGRESAPRRGRVRFRRPALRPDERSHVGRAAPLLEALHRRAEHGAARATACSTSRAAPATSRAFLRAASATRAASC